MNDKIDTGKHYRHAYKGIKMDPYRVFEIFNVTDAKAQHAIKKLLRFEDKGHTRREVWLEIQDIVDRALEMLDEDEVIHIEEPDEGIFITSDVIIDKTLLQEKG